MYPQELGPIWLNPLKYAISNAVAAGVEPSTIFLPAALSVVFVATGPLVGLGLFLIIVIVSTLTRLVLKKLKLRLQYLPRMAFILLAVVVGVLLTFLVAPQAYVWETIARVSIFPLLILVLLAEDFTRAQIGKSAKTAVSLTTETLILALASFVFLTLQELQRYAILHPELLLVIVAVFNLFMGRYVGLRFV